MKIYLIRHTTPDIQKGLCYGQSDLAVTDSFLEEARCIRPHLPAQVDKVYSSPLQRCSKLAQHLFPGHSIEEDDRLKEIHCGDWEMKLWDEIEPALLKTWMDDSINTAIPGGESYKQLYERVCTFIHSLPQRGTIAVVTHGGVIRSWLSFVQKISLQESFDAVALRYGCVVQVQWQYDASSHTVLHNPPAAPEQHRPSYY